MAKGSKGRADQSSASTPRPASEAVATGVGDAAPLPAALWCPAPLPEAVWRNRTAAARAFHETVWPIERVLAWVALREPLRINESVETIRHSFFLLDIPVEERMKRLDSRLGITTPVELHDRDFGRSVLSAVQDGSLSGIKNGRRLEPEEWVSRTERDLFALPVVLFYRKEVLAIWPELHAVSDAAADDEAEAPAESTAEKCQSADEESLLAVPGTGVLVRRWRLPARPLGANGRANMVTAAWDTIGHHPIWSSKGLPPNSLEQAAAKVTEHFESLIKTGKLNVDGYDNLRSNAAGKISISQRTLGRALIDEGRPQQSRNSAGKSASSDDPAEPR
jgi:hypothetical protein